MAKCPSDVVARDVTEVPLTTISSIDRRSGCTEDLQDLIQKALRSTKEARAEIEIMSASIQH